MAPIIFCYWELRGLAEPISYLLHHVGADVQIKRLTSSENGYKSWLEEKFTLGLDFPNLPYLIDGDVKLTQSLAIIRYLARKFNLAGNNEAEFMKIDLVEQQARDLQSGLAQLAYNPDAENQLKGYLESLPAKLSLLSQYLGERDWFVGDSVTYVDFLAYEALDQNRLLSPSTFANYDNLKEFLTRVESLPNIKAYIESGSYKKWPIFSIHAKLLSGGEMPE